MYQQIMEAGEALKCWKKAKGLSSDLEAAGEGLAGSIEDLMRAMAQRDPDLAEVVDKILGNDGEEED